MKKFVSLSDKAPKKCHYNWKYFQFASLFNRNPWLINLIAIIFLSLFMLWTLFACEKQETENLSTIRLAEVTRSVFYAPFYVTISEGYFEAEGLGIELLTTPGGDKTMTTLLSGGADIILVGAETSIYVASQGAKDKVLNFAVLTETDGTFLVAREPIADFQWQQLVGSTFLGQRVGGMPQMVSEYVLKQHHVDPHLDLNLIQNIDFANIPSAFASGTGDFVQLFEPTASLFEAEGNGYVVASFGTESGAIPYTTFMAHESFMELNSEIIAAFTRALYRAQQWVATQPATAVATSIADFFPDTSLEILTKSVERYQLQHAYATTPLIDETMWEQLQTIMIDARQLTEPAPYEWLVDTVFATEAITKER